MLTEHVVDNGEYLSFSIPDTKNHEPREFYVTPGNVNGIDLLGLLRKYISLRPATTTNNRFFVGYRNGKCTIQPVGINTFGQMPGKIASFLGLNNVERFTGHCFRRSSATILAEGGAGLITIKQVGGWKSNRVAEGYIHNTSNSKRKLASRIFGSSNEAGTSKKRATGNIGPVIIGSSDKVTRNPITMSVTEINVPVETSIYEDDLTMDAKDVSAIIGDADMIFDNANGIATVHTITSSQITKQSVAIPNTVAQINPPVVSLVTPTVTIPGAQNNYIPGSISGSTFHGCTFHFHP